MRLPALFLILAALAGCATTPPSRLEPDIAPPLVISRIEFRDGALRLVPIEDMIADRMGQALAGPRRDQAMRDQAVWLYRFASSPDRPNLDRRIREETANQATVDTREAWAHEDD